MSDVGEIVGRLRLDDSDWMAKLDAAEVKARELSGVDPKIVVRTEGTAQAVTQLGTVAAAEDRVERSTRKVAVAQKDGQRQAIEWRGALVGGLVAASSAAPPVAAAAIGITGALGAMGVAGALGLAGIARGLKENDQVGQQYRGTINALSLDVHSLQDSAARGLFPGVEQSSAVLSARLPALNVEVAHFAGMLGANLPVGLDAVVTLVERANPLLDAAGNYVGRMADGLDSFAHSQGYRDFLTYSVQSLPEVEKFLGDTVHLVGDFVNAWAPVGSVTLPMLDHLVTGADDIVKHTGPLVPGVIAVVGAYNLLKPAIGIVESLTAKTILLGEAEEAAAVAGGGKGGLNLGGVTGIAGGIGALSIVGAHSVADDSPATKTRILSQVPTAKRAQAISSTFDANVFGAGGAGFAFGTTFADQDKQLANLVKSGNATKAAQMWAAMGRAAATNGISIEQLTAAYPRYSAAAASGEGKVKSATDATSRALTTQITAWDAVAAAQRTAASNAQGLESAQDAAKDAISGLTAAVKTNGTSLSQSTDKGRANREQVLAAVQAAQAYGDEVTKVTGSTEAGRVATDKMAIALEGTMVKLGMSKSAATGYVNKLLGIPSGRSTKLDLQDAEAKAKLEAFAARWDAMQSKTITLFARTNTVNDSGLTAKGFGSMARGGTAGIDGIGIPRAAAGMTVRGPGTAATDTAGLYALANGEEVVSNLFGGAASMRPFLKAVSAGKVKTRAQAAEALGVGGVSHTVVHVVGDDSAAASFVRVHVQQGLSAQQARDARTQRMGWQGKGQLAAPTGA